MAYTVAVSDGYVTDSNGAYVRESVVRRCGHEHRTEVTAEACRQRLTKTYGKGSNRRASAAWYNSVILCDGKR